MNEALEALKEIDKLKKELDICTDDEKAFDLQQKIIKLLLVVYKNPEMIQDLFKQHIKSNPE